MCTKEYSVLQRSLVQWVSCRCQTLKLIYQASPYEALKSYQIFTNHAIANENITLESLSPTFNPLFTSSPKSTDQHMSENPTRRSNNSSRSSNKAKFTSSRTSSSAFDLPQKKNLRVMNVNCRSVINKKADLEASINYIIVICGYESWFNNNIKSSEIFPENYTAYGKDRNTAGGGVFLLVRKDIVSSNQPDIDSDCEIMWAKIQLQNKNKTY